MRFFTPALPVLLAVALHAEGVVPGMNRFATTAYQDLAQNKGELILSPISIATAASMLLDGARGHTAPEIAAVLGQAYPDPKYHEAVSTLLEQITLAANSNGDELSVANGLWVQQGFPILFAFQQTIQTLYHAPLTPMNFAENRAQACEAINAWTSQHTKGRIRELLDPGSLAASTRLVVTSAIYFHGKWLSPFRISDTHPEAFRLMGGGKVETSFMHQNAVFGYHETAAAQILEMRYAGTGLVFDILLPRASGGLADLEHSMRAETISGWLGAIQNETVDVALPKFRAEAAFSLRDTLSRLGMPSAFGRSADFSGIDDRRDLYLSDVIHKAFVDVTEEGTEAAAATGGMVRMIALMQPKRFVFRADHPFMFLIRDKRSGAILFEGHLADPQPPRA
jgi:serpin B